MDLTNEQWAVIDPLIVRPPRRADGKGRPRRDDRPMLNGILWILRMGAPWPDLPDRHPPFQTRHRRFQEWIGNGTFERILTVLADDRLERGELDRSECFIDGACVAAKQGAGASESPDGAKVRSSWRLQTALVFLSPSTLSLLSRMKSPLVQTRLPRGVLRPLLNR